jgi:hypothetical protein
VLKFAHAWGAAADFSIAQEILANSEIYNSIHRRFIDSRKIKDSMPGKIRKFAHQTDHWIWIFFDHDQIYICHQGYKKLFTLAFWLIDCIEFSRTDHQWG